MDQLNILGLITKWNRQGKKDGKGGRKEDKERSNPATFSHLVVVVIVMLGMVMVLVVMVWGGSGELTGMMEELRP